MSAIPTESLPRTIKDAVEVTRNFGVQYLWVDALCIIQVAASENKDWQSELPNMGRIYRHSLFTIAASSGEHNESGLFYRIECSSWPVQNFTLINETCSSDRRMLKATIPNWNIAVEYSALSKRGWVLQERLSASRTLFFTEEGVFWQCNEAKASECKTELTGETKKEYPTLQEISADIKSSIGNTVPSKIAAMSGWLKLSERYSRKVLTVPTDRLPALLGITSDIARLSGVQFGMGTLDIYLIEGLDWCIGCPSRERPAKRKSNIPTWCWASTGQPIKFDTCEDYGEKAWKRWATELSLNRRQIRVRTYFQILHITSYTEQESRWGQGYWAHIYRCAKRRSRSNDMANCATPQSYRGEVAFDTRRDELHQEKGDIICILWKERERRFEFTNHTSAIIVMPVEGLANTYRRRGWMDIEGDGLFQDEPRDIVLV